MAFDPLFTCTQTLGDPSSINFTDLSTGTDASIASRRIFVLTAQGTYLVQENNTKTYEEWPLPLNDDITIHVLSKDTAPSITVQWVNSSGVELYSKTIPFCFSQNNDAFYYYLTQQQTANPGIIQDTNYYNNKLKLRVNIDDAKQAISFAGDYYSAQVSLDRATDLSNNESKYF